MRPYARYPTGFPVGFFFAFYFFWVGGPEGHKHNPQLCDNMLLYYPIIMLDLLDVVYAEIRYADRE